jgi:hypothetical protein
MPYLLFLEICQNLRSASDILGLSDPSTIDLDDDSLLFEDYEEGDDDDDDYKEVTYNYEYEDTKDDDNDDDDDDDDDYDDYYEEKTIVKTIVAKPKKKATAAPRPSYSYNQRYPQQQPAPPVNRKPQYAAATGAAGYAGAIGAKHYHHRRPQPPSSGAAFLGQVEGLLGAAEQNIDLGLSPHITLTGSLREALLR